MEAKQHQRHGSQDYHGAQAKAAGDVPAIEADPVGDSDDAGAVDDRHHEGEQGGEPNWTTMSIDGP